MRNVLSVAVLGASLLIAGCKNSGELRVDVVCSKLCPCVDADEQEECAAECPVELSPAEISDPCFECFVESESCFDVQLCFDVCDDSGPPEDDGPSIDAPVPLPL